MATVRKLLEKINIASRLEGELLWDEPMSLHTTFRVGGPADAWIRPTGSGAVEIMTEVLRSAREEGVPVLVLGGGANVVIADRGVRGIVLDTTGWTGCSFSDGPPSGDCPSVTVRSGTSADGAADACAERSLGGLDFLAGMPGTIGGAVWMNARCYGYSVSDVLLETDILDEDLERCLVPFDAAAFSYKRSPFQDRDVLIVSARFRLAPVAPGALREAMRQRRDDRQAKGHYRLPSAGSSFKNDREFGKPTGVIVDQLGLRGLRVGDAQVAPWHGNIIVNTGAARAADIRRLARLVAGRVREELGLELETEMLFLGEWDLDDI